MKKQSTSRSAFFNPRLLIGFALCSLGLLLALVGWSKSVTGTIATKAPAQAPGTGRRRAAWPPRDTCHTATLLPNGQVLVAGGGANCFFCDALASAELYDPVSGLWTVTGSLATARHEHTATLLPNGKVLVAGGYELRHVSRARNSMIRRPGYGPATGSMATARYSIPRRSCPTARCSSLGDSTAASTVSRARNSMIRRPGCGPRRAAWPPRDTPIPRRSCPTARCSSLGDYGHASRERGTL